MAGRVVAACPPPLDGAALGRGQRARVIEFKAGGLHQPEFLRVSGPRLRDVSARAAGENKDLDVEDVSFRGEVVVCRFPGRSKPDQLAEHNHYWVEQSDEDLEFGQFRCSGGDVQLGVQQLQMSTDRVVLADGLGHEEAKQQKIK
ncbi:hypothetical protein KL930_003948 [Ogataea haglerorum]|uniref:Uncharacterized protein n=1 Tax=Ogataea haglerorum TaxID=1937702 RepID=A0AAN6D3C8_9ASCO|nr:hypothetical protein KL933_003552 [Ogataea haglerorum]KAG7729650.1 hypothetical protein KL948_003804 [Ogataea haglerorum]KAG7740663.1 hypothetical protein KL932_003022 [Ogataea haglerorum]KAG7746729.1 hypothetical protein KL912_003858 [Ogataea haglerorum]KAG7766387.1 hypothetical protein KL931_004225 [Ogataea haglerorum]